MGVRAIVARLLIDRFLVWARANGSAEAVVNVYAANERAQAVYARHGFARQSVEMKLALERRD
jgi:GNAT superfamily N-acetyltransferase